MATNTGTVSTTNTGSITTVTSSFVEGQSTVRPPLFNGSNYAYWACRMKKYLQSVGLDTWNITQTEYSEPTTAFAQWTVEQKTIAQNNSKAMNILFCSLDRNEFNRVSVCKSAYECYSNSSYLPKLYDMQEICFMGVEESIHSGQIV